MADYRSDDAFWFGQHTLHTTHYFEIWWKCNSVLLNAVSRHFHVLFPWSTELQRHQTGSREDKRFSSGYTQWGAKWITVNGILTQSQHLWLIRLNNRTETDKILRLSIRLFPPSIWFIWADLITDCLLHINLIGAYSGPSYTSNQWAEWTFSDGF